MGQRGRGRVKEKMKGRKKIGKVKEREREGEE